MIYKSLTSFVDNVQKANTKATYRGMNKATAKINTQMKRNLSKDLGLKSKDINKRLKVKKASASSLSTFISVGVKYGVPLSLFSPKVKVVKKNKRRYQGVTVKIPAEGGRYLVPNAFLATVKSGKSLVLARTTKARKPIKSVLYNINKNADAQRAKLQPALAAEFKAQYLAQVQLEINK